MVSWGRAESDGAILTYGASVWVSGDGGAHSCIVWYSRDWRHRSSTKTKILKRWAGRSRQGSQAMCDSTKIPIQPIESVGVHGRGMMSLRQWAWVAAVGIFSLLVFLEHSHIHGVTTVSKVEILLLLLSTETEVAILGLLRRKLGHVACIVLIIREIFLDDVVCLHVDLLVGVVLAIVDLLHTANFLNKKRISVDWVTGLLRSFFIHFTNFEDVLQAIKSNLDNLVVGACQEVAKRLNATALDEVPNLFRLLKATRGCVRDCPASFLPRLEITILEKVNKRRNYIGINHRLDLCGVTSSDV